MDKYIDECEFTHFIYENYPEDVAEEVDKIFGDSFGMSSMNTFYRVENPEDKFDECLNAFLDSRPELGDKVQMIFTN